MSDDFALKLILRTYDHGTSLVEKVELFQKIELFNIIMLTVP